MIIKYQHVAYMAFIGAIIFFVALLGFSSQVQAQENADAAGNATCAASWKKLYQEAVQKKIPSPEQYANQKNRATPCGSKCPGKCDVPESGGSMVTVCRGDGGTPDCPAAKDGGGKPPELPKPPEKKPEEEKPKDECPPGQEKDTKAAQKPGGQAACKPIVCPLGQKLNTDDITGKSECKPEDEKATSTRGANPLANFIPSSVKNLFSELFGGPEKPGMDVTRAGGDSHTFEGQLKAIANSADPESPANKGVRAYVTAQKKSGETPLTAKQFNALRVAAEADPQGFAEQVRAKFPSIPELNDLLPARGVFGEGPAGFDGTVPSQTSWINKIANAIGNLISGLFR